MVAPWGALFAELERCAAADACFCAGARAFRWGFMSRCFIRIYKRYSAWPINRPFVLLAATFDTVVLGLCADSTEGAGCT